MHALHIALLDAAAHAHVHIKVDLPAVRGAHLSHSGEAGLLGLYVNGLVHIGKHSHIGDISQNQILPAVLV